MTTNKEVKALAQTICDRVAVANIDLKEIEKALGISRYAFWTWRRGESPASKAGVELMKQIIKTLDKLIADGTLPVRGAARFSRLRGNSLFKVAIDKP